MTHARTHVHMHMVQIMISLRRAGREIIKCSKCNTFQVIIDLVHDFMNFIALKIILKINKKKS